MRPYAVCYELFPSDRDEVDPALQFAPRGRVLSVPEINGIRRYHHPLDPSPHNPWNIPFLTSSTEYRGLSPKGKELVAVHHPRVGEPFPDRTSMDPHGFRRLLDGAYGDVEVFEVPNAAYQRETKYPEYAALTVARFGGEDVTHALAKQLDRQLGSNGKTPGFRGMLPRYASFPSSERIIARPLATYGLRTMRRMTSGSLERIPGYELVVETQRPPSLDQPIFMALQQYPETPVAVAPSVTPEAIMLDPSKAGWIDGSATTDEMIVVKEFSGKLMTDGGVMAAARGCRPPISRLLHTSTTWPEYEVISFAEIGGLVEADMPDIYTTSKRPTAPPGANAFRIVWSDFGLKGIQFGHAVLDTGKRMPDPAVLMHDWYYRREITSEHSARWWLENGGVEGFGATRARFRVADRAVPVLPSKSGARVLEPLRFHDSRAAR